MGRFALGIDDLLIEHREVKPRRAKLATPGNQVGGRLSWSKGEDTAFVNELAVQRDKTGVGGRSGAERKGVVERANDKGPAQQPLDERTIGVRALRKFIRPRDNADAGHHVAGQLDR